MIDRKSCVCSAQMVSSEVLLSGQAGVRACLGVGSTQHWTRGARTNI